MGPLVIQAIIKSWLIRDNGFAGACELITLFMLHIVTGDIQLFHFIPHINGPSFYQPNNSKQDNKTRLSHPLTVGSDWQ